MAAIKIGKHTIGAGHERVYIIAELSANHHGSYDLAARTIEAMHKAGADAVKMQTYTPDSLTIDSDKEAFMARKGTLWEGRKLYDLFREGAMPYAWQGKLKKVAEDLGMDCFSSPFDKEGVDFLESIDVPAYKIASLEITDIPLITYVAGKQKPVILSTGVAEWADIELAVDTCRAQANHEIALLKCTSAYPTPLEEVHLRAIPGLEAAFGVVTGLSDHTLGISVPIAAVALGARIVEKHFILDKSKGGIDATFSLEPDAFSQMVHAIRETEKALGDARYRLTESAQNARKSRRSLFVVQDIAVGEKFTGQHIRAIRPGHGLHPQYLGDIIGKKAVKSVAKGTPVQWDMVSKG